MSRPSRLNNRVKVKGNSARITFIAGLFFVLFALVIFRLFVLQVLRQDFFAKLAAGQYEILKDLLPERGKIYASDKDSNWWPVADNKEMHLLYGVPAEIESATTTLSVLSKAMNLSDEEKSDFIKRLSKKNDPYEPLKHYLTEEEKDKIKEYEIADIGFIKEIKRFYPEKNIFAHILGFLGFKGSERTGQYGLEEYYEKELKGEPGFLKSEKDPYGRLIGVGSFEIEHAKNGAQIYLTIDRLVQFKSCEVLKTAVEKYNAAGGVVIVQKPKSGEILAMCSKPDFDPNDYAKVDSIEVYKNNAIFSAYEPGSVFKPITISAGIDSGSIGPDNVYEDSGLVQFGKDIITNADNKSYGIVNMTQVLENSINTGAVYVAQKTGRDEIKKYVENFGFGKKLGIDLPSESSGDVSALNKKGDIYLATASFGQGISVTPLQLVSAFSAIINGGILYKPYLVDKIIDINKDVQDFKAQEVRRVIASKTSNILKAMLVSVVKNGHTKSAQIDGYFVGGKTGTAQIAGKDGGYINAYNHTFIGFAPASNPEFVVLVQLSRPTSGRYAESTTVPTFVEIMKFLLQYYQVPTEY